MSVNKDGGMWHVGMMVCLRAVTLDNDGDGLCTSTLRELKLMSQLRHPHIICLLEIVRDKNSEVASNATYTNPSGTVKFKFNTKFIGRCHRKHPGARYNSQW